MSQPPDFLLFFGRLHPLLVHLPIGLIVVLAFLEILARWTRYKHANASAGYILALAGLVSVATVLFGWLLALEGGYDERLLQLHRWTGVAVGVACLLAWILHHYDLKKAYHVMLFATVAVLVVASHFGGSLTHGSDYLVEYAPGPLRKMLGGKAAAKVESTANKPDVSKLPAFAGVVQPVLNEYCVGCHGPEKSKGSLRLDSIPAIMKGGQNGPALVAGNPGDSLLLKRIHLPPEDEDHMPPDGKPQPEEDDIKLLEWWIQEGASAEAVVASLKPAPAVLKILEKRHGAPPPPAAPPVPPLSREEAIALAEKASADLGVPITLLSEKDAWIQVSAGVAGTNFGDTQLGSLAPLARNVQWLDLGGTSITDDGLAPVQAMLNLKRLHLDRTAISDQGMDCLLKLEQLEYLNLYGSQVGDEGLQKLDALPKLKQIFLWQSKVTPEGAQSFKAARLDERQLREWEQEIEQIKARIRNARITVDIGAPLPTPPPATNAAPVNANCPVSGKPADKTKTVEHEGKLVAFCCDDCKAKFQKDPTPFLDKIKPATEVAPVNANCPVSGKPVDKTKTVEHEGQLVAFCCDDCKAKFQKDPKSFVDKIKP